MAKKLAKIIATESVFALLAMAVTLAVAFPSGEFMSILMAFLLSARICVGLSKVILMNALAVIERQTSISPRYEPSAA